LIPLHTLSSQSKSSRSEKLSSRRSSSSLSGESDLSILSGSDTGDLVYQLGEQEDSLSIRLEENLPRSQSKRSRRGRHVHYASDFESDNEKQAGFPRRKEDILIPEPPQRTISLGERLLVRIMAPNDGPSRLHGLHGQKLMY